MDIEDLVSTLETIVERFGEDIAPFAVTLCQQLVAAFWRLQVRGCAMVLASLLLADSGMHCLRSLPAFWPAEMGA